MTKQYRWTEESEPKKIDIPVSLVAAAFMMQYMKYGPPSPRVFTVESLLTPKDDRETVVNLLQEFLAAGYIKEVE